MDLTGVGSVDSATQALEWVDRKDYDESFEEVCSALDAELGKLRNVPAETIPESLDDQKGPTSPAKDEYEFPTIADLPQFPSADLEVEITSDLFKGLL